MNDSRPASIIQPVLKGCAAALATAVLLLLAFTLCAYKSADPDSLIVPLSAAALLISSAAGGFVSTHSRTATDSCLPEVLTGALTGLMISIAVFLAGLFPLSSGAERSSGTTLLLYLGVAVIGAVGGITGKRRKLRRYHRHRVPKRR